MELGDIAQVSFGYNNREALAVFTREVNSGEELEGSDSVVNLCAG